MILLIFTSHLLHSEDMTFPLRPITPLTDKFLIVNAINICLLVDIQFGYLIHARKVFKFVFTLCFVVILLFFFFFFLVSLFCLFLDV